MLHKGKRALTTCATWHLLIVVLETHMVFMAAPVTLGDVGWSRTATPAFTEVGKEQAMY